MSTKLVSDSSCEFDVRSEQTWENLISFLQPLTRYLVYSAHMKYWRGTEEDIMEDITQETLRRLFERIQKAEQGDKLPIRSVQHMSAVIARNYCIDMRRRDRRLQRVPSHEIAKSFSFMDVHVKQLEIAIERASQKELFMRLASEVVRFPPKQRKALLIDLANRMHFDAVPTPLQQAFLAQGIDLQLYQQPLPRDRKERARLAVLTSLAYKRITTCMRNYDLDK